MLRDQIRPYVTRIVKRELTNREVARELNVSEGAVCRVLKQLKVKRDPVPNNDAERIKAAERRELRTTAAQTMSIKDAAAHAGCSTRTIYRLRKKP
jgi:transposase